MTQPARSTASGDGAGLLVKLPDKFLRREMKKQGVTLPPAGQYGVAQIFLPKDMVSRSHCINMVEEVVESYGMTVLGWRDVPVVSDMIGPTALSVMPVMRQLVLTGGGGAPDESGLDLERRVWLCRKRIERRTTAYPVSLSTRTITYKGMLTTDQLDQFYPAEKYHAGYFRNNPSQPYCAFVVAPKVSKFRKMYMDRLKADV